MSTLAWASKDQPCGPGLHPGLPGWRDWREVFPHGLDHSSSPNPEPRANSNSSVKQQPDGSRCFLQDSTLFVNQPQRYQRTNGITGREKRLDEFYKHCTDKWHCTQHAGTPQFWGSPANCAYTACLCIIPW